MSEQSAGSRFGVAEEDWHVVLEGRANVLLVGPEPIVAEVVETMRPSLEGPIAHWLPGDSLPGPCETLLVENADRLTLDEQRQLDGCLVDLAHPQVVTLASMPLFPLVEQGRFLASLYYRLNVVYLTFEASGNPGP